MTVIITFLSVFLSIVSVSAMDFGVGYEKGLCLKVEWNANCSSSIAVNYNLYSFKELWLDTWKYVHNFDISFTPLLYDFKIFEWLDLGIGIEYRTNFNDTEWYYNGDKKHYISFIIPSFEFKLNQNISVYLQLVRQIIVWSYTDQNCPSGFSLSFDDVKIDNVNLGLVFFFR